MARIRTIKPAFFRHHGLWKAERETKLPLRLSFAGLWTAADREGRFKWDPPNLKLDCIPYDDLDFSRVLDALLTRGWIGYYTTEQGEFGYIPSWKVHQFINNREKPSDLPDPLDKSIVLKRVTHAYSTRERNTQAEGEGKGNMEGEGDTTLSAVTPADFINTWNTSCGSYGLASVKRLNDKRTRQLRTRLHDPEFTPEKIWKWIAESKGVHGQQWFTLDWILNEANFTKLIEGKYLQPFEKGNGKARPAEMPMCRICKERPVSVNEGNEGRCNHCWSLAADHLGSEQPEVEQDIPF